jgi:predicted permease
MFFWLITMFAYQAMQLCMRFCFLLFCNSFLEQVDASFFNVYGNVGKIIDMNINVFLIAKKIIVPQAIVLLSFQIAYKDRFCA